MNKNEEGLLLIALLKRLKFNRCICSLIIDNNNNQKKNVPCHQNTNHIIKIHCYHLYVPTLTLNQINPYFSILTLL